MEKAKNKIERHRISRGDYLKGGKDMFRIAKCIISVLLAVGLGILIVHGDALGGGKIRGIIVGDPINLDPAHVTYTQDRTITQQVYQGLVTFDVTAEPPHPVVPELAKSFEISKDGKTITFKLHKGVQFHGGYGELTSEDVVFSLQRHLDPKVASRAKGEVADIERVEALDKYTVRIHLKTSSAIALMGNLAWQNAGFILSKKACAKLGDKIATMPIGTGPFYFDRWYQAEKVVLKKFKKYWRTPAKIDEIEYWIVAEETVALGALEKGDLDLVPIMQEGSYERAKAIKGIQIIEPKGGISIAIYYINHKMKPMDDVRVRKALAHALDIKRICSRIGPMVAAFPSPLPQPVFAATDEFWTYKYDLDKAKQLLAEAGYPNGFELRIIYNRDKLYEPIALEVKRSLDKIVDVKLELIERAVFSKTIKKFKQHITAWGLSRMTPYLYAERYKTGSPRNYSKYSNPEVDNIILKATSARTEEEAKKYWREFQRMVTEDAANLWIANVKNIVAISNKVKGVQLNPYLGLMVLEKAYIE
jgi:peptide/nickel transport system substrate-binding protein